ncbi:MAG: alpha/beta hydrolase, partial [Pyrinomonadaceae bacterium]|nr:alpha/beta hydrolase [Pyrinomonadaceae bacterium]
SLGTPVDKYDYEFLRDCRKPILFVSGDKDEFSDVVKLRELAESLPPEAQAKLVVFENCGHFFDEHLNELKSTISEWITTQI